MQVGLQLSPCCYHSSLTVTTARVQVDYGTLYTNFQLTQGTSANVVVSQRKTLIRFDLGLYVRALKIQQSTGNTNWILIAFAAMQALGKMIDGSGLDTGVTESDAYTSAALRKIFGGKA